MTCIKQARSTVVPVAAGRLHILKGTVPFGSAKDTIYDSQWPQMCSGLCLYRHGQSARCVQAWPTWMLCVWDSMPTALLPLILPVLGNYFCLASSCALQPEQCVQCYLPWPYSQSLRLPPGRYSHSSMQCWGGCRQAPACPSSNLASWCKANNAVVYWPDNKCAVVGHVAVGSFEPEQAVVA